jgi:hypothetical protein
MRAQQITDPIAVQELRARAIRAEAISREDDEPAYPWFSLEDLRAQVIQAHEDIAAGRYITSEELKRRMATW